MTRQQFDYMAENVLGSGRYEDGEKFSFYVKGSSVIIQKEGTNKAFPFICEGWELDSDGEPVCYGTWFDK